MSQPPARPSLLGLVALFSRIAFTVLCRALTYPLRTNSAPTLKKDVFFAALRTMLRRITIAQFRYLSPGSTQCYLDFCSKNTVVPRSLFISRSNRLGGGNAKDAIAAHWIGSPDANIVVLYLHGGGFTQPATEGYFHYQKHLTEIFNGSRKTKSLAFLSLAYTLAPEAKYPTQLQEASAVLSHLIHEEGRSPTTIMICGDSAGGGLALSLLSHLLHPHPNVPAIQLSAPLADALLFSPWVSFSTDSDSMRRNFEKDMLEPTMLRRWAAMYLGKSKDDPETDPGPISGDAWTEAAGNEVGWWKGMHRAVSDVFVWFGEDEMLGDQIEEFRRVFMDGWVEGGGDIERVAFVKTPRRSHIEPIMSVMMYPKERGEHSVAVEEWLAARLVEK